MLMSTIVDGGLYRESTFMLQGLFSPELIANRNRFVLTVGAIMVGVACLSMAMGLFWPPALRHRHPGLLPEYAAALCWGKIESLLLLQHSTTSPPPS